LDIADEVVISTRIVLVQGAAVNVGRLGVTLLARHRHLERRTSDGIILGFLLAFETGVHVDDGHALSTFPKRGVDELLHRAELPRSTIEEETVDQDGTIRSVSSLFDTFFVELSLNLIASFDLVKRPDGAALVLGDLGASDFLTNTSEETLGVEETGEPEVGGSSETSPGIKLGSSSLDIVHPHGDIGGRPGDGDPGWRNTSVLERSGGVLESRREDELTLPGELQVTTSGTNHADSNSKAIDFLTSKDRQGLSVFKLVLLGRVPGLGEIGFEKVLDSLFETSLSIRVATTGGARLTVDDGIDGVGGLLGAVGDVGVGVHAEDLGGIVVGVRLEHELLVLGQLVERGQGVAVAGALAVDEVGVAGLGLEDLGVEERERDRVEENTIVVVGDASTVLNLRDHVADRLPADRVLLGVLAEQRQVVLEELHRREPVTLVELVGNSEADGAELAALLDDGVEEALGEEEGLPFDAAEGLDDVLRHPRERADDTSTNTLRRLVGELDGHLKKTNGEFLAELGGDEEASIFVDRDLRTII